MATAPVITSPSGKCTKEFRSVMTPLGPVMKASPVAKDHPTTCPASLMAVAHTFPLSHHPSSIVDTLSILYRRVKKGYAHAIGAGDESLGRGVRARYNKPYDLPGIINTISLTRSSYSRHAHTIGAGDEGYAATHANAAAISHHPPGIVDTSNRAKLHTRQHAKVFDAHPIGAGDKRAARANSCHLACIIDGGRRQRPKVFHAHSVGTREETVVSRVGPSHHLPGIVDGGSPYIPEVNRSLAIEVYQVRVILNLSRSMRHKTQPDA